MSGQPASSFRTTGVALGTGATHSLREGDNARHVDIDRALAAPFAENQLCQPTSTRQSLRTRLGRVNLMGADARKRLPKQA